MNEYQNLRKLFNDHKCALLSKDQLDLDKLTFVCSCNREKCISLDEFNRDDHCDSCNGKTKKHTFAYIKQQFELFNVELVSTEYIDNKSEIKY